MEMKIGFTKPLMAFFRELFLPLQKQRLKIEGGEFVFNLLNSNADVRFSLSPVVARDVEGELITLTEELVSSDEGVISLVFDEGSSASNPRAGVAHVGTSGLASVTYTAKDPAGNIVKPGGAQFSISTGEIASVEGGDLAFEGIVES